MNLKKVGIFITVIFFFFAAFNLLVCAKAIMLGQWENGGKMAFYLMVFGILLGAYAPCIVGWLSKFLSDPNPLKGRK